MTGGNRVATQPDLLAALPQEPTHDAGGRRLPLPPGVVATAMYGGPLGCYRYRLEWVWDASLPALMCLGMNPSTASHLNGDATVCKLHRMARSRGFGRLLMANVFAYRVTDQGRLLEVEDPVGEPDNHRHVLEMARQASEVWVCHGKPRIAALRQHGPALARLLAGEGICLKALRVAADNTPWHPLYVLDDTVAQPWRPK